MMTEKIKQQILAIRDTGLTNMFDVNMVQRLAYERISMSWLFTSKNIARNMCILSSTARNKVHKF